MGRKIGAVAAGVAVVSVVVFALHFVGSLIHPLPPGVSPSDPEDAAAFRAYLATMPPISWALAFFSELLGAFLGGLTAAKIAESKQRLFGGSIVGLALAGSVMNWLSFDHPVWFMAGQLVMYPLVYLALIKLLPTNPYEGV